MTRRAATALAGLVGSGLLALGLPAAPSPAAAAEEADLRCAGDARPEVVSRTDTPSSVLAALQVPAAHERATGRGVSVAVVDSGVADTGRIRLAPGWTAPGVGTGAPVDGHGTIVAGLVAAADKPGGRGVGVAPGATVVPVRVLDADDPGEGQRPATPDAVAAGLEWVADNAEQRGIGVAVAALRVGASPALRQAVGRVVDAGVVLVAAAGNLEQEEDPLPPGGDAEVWPADYPGVLGVSAAAPPGTDPAGSVLRNADTDVAAPTVGATSVLVDGSDCVVDEVATSWAAAEVAGVVALLREAYPDDTVAQLVRRVVATADGVEDARNPFTGAGSVQPLAALRSDLALGPDGSAPGLVATDDLGGAAASPPPSPRRPGPLAGGLRLVGRGRRGRAGAGARPQAPAAAPEGLSPSVSDAPSSSPAPGWSRCGRRRRSGAAPRRARRRRRGR